MSKIKTIVFWTLSFTWGLPMTFIGACSAIVLMIAGYKPEKFNGYIYFTVGKNWGGVNFGCFFIVSEGVTMHTKRHEAGHGIQNIILGWFMPFVVAIPSVIRYWCREWLVKTGKKSYSELPPYDAVWFEGWATNLGRKFLV